VRTEIIADPGEFRERAAPLLADEARHNLMLGIVGTLISSPEVYPESRLYLVSDGLNPRSAALMTPPYDLVVADTNEPAAIMSLVDALVHDAVTVPGALGNRPTIDLFVKEWENATGDEVTLQMAQGVFSLVEVAEVEGGPGKPRRAVPRDQALIETWMQEFLDEALPDEPRDDARMSRMIAKRLSGDEVNEYWLWEDGGDVVAWTGHGNPTGRGIRIGPVYTPPQLRGRGYATSLVAAQSRWLLENGFDFCFLYTDLANPTSNAIYELMGYRQVAESAKYGFGRPSRQQDDV
jgi:predicted GNAT family acetyltransferase